MKNGPPAVKMLVILPREDIRMIEEEIEKGRYVTKSDFLRVAVKMLLGKDGMIGTRVPQLQDSARTLTKATILGILSSNQTMIKSFGVKRVGLFGSYARGEQRPESDVDILVEFSRGRKRFHNYMQLKMFLEKLFGRKVDLVIKEDVKPALRKSILEGVEYA